MKQSIAFGMKKIGIPCIVLNCKGVDLHFLIDTGSTANHLAGYTYLYFTQFDDVIKDLENSYITSGLGGCTHSKGCSFSFSIGRAQFQDEFVVQNNFKAIEKLSEDLGEPIAGILGGKFLKMNNIVIDYGNNCIYTKRIRKKKKDNKAFQEAA